VSIPPASRRIKTSADRIRCRMGDVDTTLHDCTLTFGHREITRAGRTGQLLLATLQQNGAQSDGAAGTIYYTVTDISCLVDATRVEMHEGVGATCTFTNGE
jgi:hypothetical protein